MGDSRRNPVEIAIGILGGPTRAVAALNGEVSESTWHRWRRAGRIGDIDLVPRIADMTGLAREDLAGWTVHVGGRQLAARNPSVPGETRDARSTKRPLRASTPRSSC